MFPTETQSLTRRQLLRGDVSGGRTPIRPPWAIAEAQFVVRCDRCGHCIECCEERVIRAGSGGFPQMDFSARGCSLCGACVAACEGKALTEDPGLDRPWDQVASIATHCLANLGVVCRSCGDVCDERAIRFELRVGGAALPRLNDEQCTGCGFCIGVCPVQAIDLAPAPERRTPLAEASDMIENSVHQEYSIR